MDGGTTVDGAQLVTSYGFIPWPRADGRLNPILSPGWTLNYEAFFYAASLWRCASGAVSPRSGPP